MRPRWLWWIAVVLAVAVVGLGALAYRPPIAPIGPPAASSFSATQIARGEQLAGAGYCATCHTAAEGAPYAGGRGLPTPFGVIYSTNITPDSDTGIGRWSGAAFERALHEGVSRDGAQLFPAFPYPHFAKMTQEDIASLYAYLMTRTAVHAEAKSNTLPFPLNVRALQAGWKLLFFSPDVFQPVSGKSPSWNRGAYLAQGVSHCGACHTPLNSLGAERRGEEYGGAVVDAWLAPALTAASPAPLPWTEEDLFDYLRSGGSVRHGVALGPMSEVHQGLAHLPDADVRAIATYFADIDGSQRQTQTATAPLAAAPLPDALSGELAHGANLYLAACSFCHYNSGPSTSLVRPVLALSTKLAAGDPANLLHVILQGVGTDQGIPGEFMPGFASAWSDADVAALADYLRSTHTAKAPWPNLLPLVAEVRAHDASP